MRPKIWLLVVLAVLLSAVFIPIPSQATCTLYQNSMAMDFDLPAGPACGQTGPGCNECVNFSSSGGFSACYWSIWPDYYCFYYGNPPENQFF